MANRMLIGTCDICGQEGQCIPVTFIPGAGKDGVMVKPYKGMAGNASKEISLQVCEACGRECGRTCKGSWITALIGHFLTIAGYFLLTKGRDYGPVSSMMIIIGWVMAIIASTILVVNIHHERGKKGLFVPVFLICIPMVGMLPLLLYGKSINRCCRAKTALRPVAVERQRAAQAQNEAMARREEKGEALTEAEQAQLADWKQEQEAAARQEQSALEAQAKKANGGNLWYAVLSLLFTIALAIYGADVYQSGRGYMQLFGTLKLSGREFMVLIILLLIGDVIYLLSALKKKNRS